MFRHLFAAATASVVLSMGVANAAPVALSVNFAGSSGAFNVNISPTTEVGSYANWNNVSTTYGLDGTQLISGAAFVDSSGDVLPGNFSIYLANLHTEGGRTHGAHNTPTMQLLNSLVSFGAAGGNLTLSNLDTVFVTTGGTTYDLYVYHSRDGGAAVRTISLEGTGLAYDVNNATATVNTVLVEGTSSGQPLPPAGEFGANYVVFRDLTASDLTLAYGGAGSAARGFAGFQVVGTLIPEPASLSILAIGAVALLRRRSPVQQNG